MKEIKTWDDYCKVHGDSMYFETNELRETSIIWENNDVPTKMRDRWIAEYRISKLMPYYGGAITDKEWKDKYMDKFVIRLIENNQIQDDITTSCHHLLAFHTWDQRDNFLEHNEELVNKYFGI